MQILSATVLVIIIGCRLGCSQEEGEYYPRVVTPLGTIEGFYNTSSEGRPYESYLGIPYASPPTGEQRFRVAKPVRPWTGILMAKRFGSSCLQFKIVSSRPPIYTAIGSEDCLFLNIYTPAVDRDSGVKTSADLLPVIFYIHGGGFTFGTGAEFGPQYLLNKRVIFVTINYRMGPLGFLSTEDDTVPGNMGLKDQVIAMRWVKDNIIHFGGNPNEVTLIGQSAGAAAAHYHYMTNATADLFQRGMSISGTALNCWAETKNALENAKRLAISVECPSSNVSTMVECLRNRTADQITLALGEFTSWFNSPVISFGPVIEKGRSEFTMIDRPPVETIVSGRVQNKPWITTVVSEEGLFPAAFFAASTVLLEELNDDWENIAPHLLNFNLTIPEQEKNNVSRLIRQHYLGTNPIDNTTIGQIVRIISDRLFHYDPEKAARLQARVNQSPVRFYYFSYRGAHSLSELLAGNNVNYGVSHSDDITYVMDTIFDTTTTHRDREMQKVLVDLWVSYATHGVPDVGVQWPRVDPAVNEFQYLHIAGPNDIRINASLNFGDKSFWQSIPFHENVIPPMTKTRRLP